MNIIGVIQDFLSDTDCRTYLSDDENIQLLNAIDEFDDVSIVEAYNLQEFFNLIEGIESNIHYGFLTEAIEDTNTFATSDWKILPSRKVEKEIKGKESIYRRRIIKAISSIADNPMP